MKLRPTVTSTRRNHMSVSIATVTSRPIAMDANRVPGFMRASWRKRRTSSLPRRILREVGRDNRRIDRDEPWRPDRRSVGAGLRVSGVQTQVPDPRRLRRDAGLRDHRGLPEAAGLYGIRDR